MVILDANQIESKSFWFLNQTIDVYQSIAHSYQLLSLIYPYICLRLCGFLYLMLRIQIELVIKFVILSAINPGLLQSGNVQPYTDQVKSRPEVSPISQMSKIEF